MRHPHIQRLFTAAGQADVSPLSSDDVAYAASMNLRQMPGESDEAWFARVHRRRAGAAANVPVSEEYYASYVAPTTVAYMPEAQTLSPAQFQEYVASANWPAWATWAIVGGVLVGGVLVIRAVAK
jgi:hypothetical protein